MKKELRPKLPQGFTKGMKKVSGDFLWGIWDTMSVGYKQGGRANVQNQKSFRTRGSRNRK